MKLASSRLIGQLLLLLLIIDVKTTTLAASKRGNSAASSAGSGYEVVRHNKVLVVSLDGFKWHYIDTYRNELGNLTRISKNVRASYAIPVFPTFTFPNHYSQVTGVYPETHGMVHNTFLVPEIHSQFVKSKTEEVYWNSSEPIWITATKQNVPNGIFFWPGSAAKLNGRTPLYFEPAYSDNVPWPIRVDTVVKWLADDDVNLAMLYFHEPDKTSHIHGPESDNVHRVLLQINDNIGYLLQKMDSRNLLSTVDLIICSDHGLTSIDKSKVVFLSDFLENELVDTFFDPALRIESWATGPVIHLWPRPEKTMDLYRLLKGKSEHFDFYLKEEMPERWHHSNSSRIGPIVGVGKLGWRAVWYRDDLNIPKIYGSLGAHGYDNAYEDMRTSFFAMGPSFRTHVTLAPFEVHHIYALIAELAGIRPVKGVAASITPFLPALRHKPRNLRPHDDGDKSGVPLKPHRTVNPVNNNQHQTTRQTGQKQQAKVRPTFSAPLATSEAAAELTLTTIYLPTFLLLLHYFYCVTLTFRII